MELTLKNKDGQVVDAVGLADNPITEAYALWLLHAAGIFTVRHEARGPQNVLEIGPQGLKNHISEKVVRALGGIERGLPGTHGEVVDSCVDAANYAIILLLLLTGSWKADGRQPDAQKVDLKKVLGTWGDEGTPTETCPPCRKNSDPGVEFLGLDFPDLAGFEAPSDAEVGARVRVLSDLLNALRS